MTRIFNIAMLCILAGIYYSQNGGFDRTADAAVAPVSETVRDTTRQKPTTPPQPVTEPIGLSMPVVTASLATSNDAGPARQETPAVTPVLARPDTNPALSDAELRSVEARFAATRLANSTVIREADPVPVRQASTGEAAAAETSDEPPVLLTVTGTVVNARERPTTRAQVVTRLTRGTEVIATGAQEGSWRQIIVVETGTTVWMHRKFLKSAS